MALSQSRLGRPRIHEPSAGQVKRVEVRLPAATAELLYASALESGRTVSATVDAALQATLGSAGEVVSRSDS